MEWLFPQNIMFYGVSKAPCYQSKLFVKSEFTDQYHE